MRITTIAMVWFCMWMLTWPAVLASFQGGHYTCEFSQEQFRSDLAFSMGWSLLPPAWIVAPFLTGFYEHGFQFTRKEPCR